MIFVHCRDTETVELNVGDEVEFSLSNSSSKPTAENIRKLKTGTILSMVSRRLTAADLNFILFLLQITGSCTEFQLTSVTML